jgi:hypothetical protein
MVQSTEPDTVATTDIDGDSDKEVTGNVAVYNGNSSYHIAA